MLKMRLLSDTHVLIWLMVGSPKLTNRCLDLLRSEGCELFFSAASLWEVALKHERKPDKIPVAAEQVERYCRECGIRQVPVRFEHALKICELEKIHADPFDRMLVSQALVEGMKLVSHDEDVIAYGDAVIAV